MQHIDQKLQQIKFWNFYVQICPVFGGPVTNNYCGDDNLPTVEIIEYV